MFIRNLRSADSEALESCLFNQSSRIVSFGALERAAGTWHLQWLFAFPALGETGDLFFDFRCIAWRKSQVNLTDCTAVLLKYAVTIAEIQFICRKLHDLPFWRNRANSRNDVLHFSIVSPGIHKYGSTYASWYTTGKFHAGKTVFSRKFRYITKKRTCPCRKCILLLPNGRNRRIKLDDGSANPLVQYEHV